MQQSYQKRDIAKLFSMPIFAIGIGEKIDDLQEFDAKNFSKKLIDIEN